MTTMLSRMLVAVGVGAAVLTMGVAPARADHYVRSCGGYGGGYGGGFRGGYASYYRPTYYRPTYYAPVYAPAPVVYSAPAYTYVDEVPYQPVTYVSRPVYYPPPIVYRSYAPAPVYRTYYSPSSFGFGFGFASHHRQYGGGFSLNVR